MDTQAFLKMVRKFVRTNYPGCKAEAITVHLKSGERIKMPVVGTAPPTTMQGAAENVAVNEKHVYDHVPGPDSTCLMPRRIAKLAGMTYNSWFRSIFARLKKKGLVIEGEGGFRKAPKL